MNPWFRSPKTALAGAVVAALFAAAPARAAPILDVVFGMDSSGSLGASGWTQEKNFVNAVITTGLPSNQSQAGVVEFATGASEKIPLTLLDSTTVSSLTSQVSALPYLAGSTYTKDAVQTAINVFDNESAAGDLKLFMLITDGVPNPPSSQNPCGLKSTLDAKGIKTVIVGVGAAFNASVIACLVDNPTTDIIQSVDFTSADLNAIVASIQSAANPVPEPATWTLLALGAGAILRRRRKRKPTRSPD